ncbi:hypothetical protein [Pseudomonas viridiflava]|uniref:hypothetical protein n=1 Tax=Pseudomonas viridiflava TaxID=33069 RepID=UPI000F0270B2|nr:hypothetical protein [Pseudomonas viridiflava]
MAKNEIRLSAEDFDGDKIPEVVVEFYKGKKMLYAAFVSDPNKDGKFDKVSGNVNVDNKEGHQKRDDNLLIALARTFMKIKF